jgi:hypothetical protein
MTSLLVWMMPGGKDARASGQPDIYPNFLLFKAYCVPAENSKKEKLLIHTLITSKID